MAKSKKKLKLEKDPDYLYTMSHTAPLGSASSWAQMIPIVIFGAFVILIVRMHIYTRPMSQFFWTNETDDFQMSEFFSYNKMVMILIAAVLALLLILFNFASQSMALKKTWLYIPIGVYSLFVILSYLFSDWKEFSLLGYNERFEGTLPILAYMVMLFFIINTINNEKNVKTVFWAISITTVILSLIGISQSLDHDFFRTLMGQKLITPNYQLEGGSTLWQEIEAAFDRGELYYNFTFQNREAYQTVYNINYVSFYLTLLIPLFGMLFIRAFNKESKEPLWKTIAFGVLFALVEYNFIYSASAGGFFGMGVIVIIAIILFNKQLKDMIKPLAVLVVISAVIFSFTTEKWLPQVKSIFGNMTTSVYAAEPGSERPWLDYIITQDDDVIISMNDDELIFTMKANNSGTYDLSLKDSEGKEIVASSIGDGFYSVEDDRFRDYIKFALQVDENNQEYLVTQMGGTQMVFTHNDIRMVYVNGFGKQVILNKVDHGLFSNNLHFGSSRGYIWSRSIPMLKHTILIGHGADTYCITFPQGDYAGRFNTNSKTWMDIIVDKPHNMYLNVGIGTGCISLLALLTLYGGYVVQSFKLFWKRQMGTDFLNFAGAGVFFGTTAFMFTGLVNDSTVSTMPMFYTLLGTGIAINFMIKRRDRLENK